MKFGENWKKIIKSEGNTDKRQSYYVSVERSCQFWLDARFRRYSSGKGPGRFGLAL